MNDRRNEGLRFTNLGICNWYLRVELYSLRYLGQGWGGFFQVCFGAQWSGWFCADTRVFHSFSVIQECQHCQLCFGTAIQY